MFGDVRVVSATSVCVFHTAQWTPKAALDRRQAVVSALLDGTTLNKDICFIVVGFTVEVKHHPGLFFTLMSQEFEVQSPLVEAYSCCLAFRRQKERDSRSASRLQLYNKALAEWKKKDKLYSQRPMPKAIRSGRPQRPVVTGWEYGDSISLFHAGCEVWNASANGEETPPKTVLAHNVYGHLRFQFDHDEWRPPVSEFEAALGRKESDVMGLLLLEQGMGDEWEVAWDSDQDPPDAEGEAKSINESSHDIQFEG